MQKLKRGNHIVVDWIDAGGRGAWGTITDFKIPEIQSVGIFIKRDRKGLYYTVGLDKNDADQDWCLSLGFIPHGCIQKIRKLK